MFRMVFVVMLLLCGSSISYACSIDEIVDMAKNGSGRKPIENTCDGEVDDAPRCSFQKVVKYALAGQRKYDIKEKCGLCEDPVCNTEGGQCVLTQGLGRLRDGGSCSCLLQGMTAWGPQARWFRGSVECNN